MLHLSYTFAFLGTIHNRLSKEIKVSLFFFLECVYMCVCVCVCVCACVCVYLNSQIHTYVHTLHAYIYSLHTHILFYICTLNFTHVHVHGITLMHSARRGEHAYKTTVSVCLSVCLCTQRGGYASHHRWAADMRLVFQNARAYYQGTYIYV